MASGVSLHIGVDRTDPVHYGPLRALRGAERDARSMAQLAEAQAFERRVVLTGDGATAAGVRRELARAAGRLRPGDTFLLTFSGYGGAVPEAHTDTAPCRTWCLYDRQLGLPLIHADLTQFVAGVRLIVVNDSGPCRLDDDDAAPGHDVRALPREVALDVYGRHQLAYDAWLAEARVAARADVKHPVIVLDACQDRELAREDAFHGRFTSALLTVWNGGRYLRQPRPTYRDLLAQVGTVLADAGQMPKLSVPLGGASRCLDAPPFVLGGG